MRDRLITIVWVFALGLLVGTGMHLTYEAGRRSGRSQAWSEAYDFLRHGRCVDAWRAEP